MIETIIESKAAKRVSIRKTPMCITKHLLQPRKKGLSLPSSNRCISPPVSSVRCSANLNVNSFIFSGINNSFFPTNRSADFVNDFWLQRGVLTEVWMAGWLAGFAFGDFCISWMMQNEKRPSARLLTAGPLQTDPSLVAPWFFSCCLFCCSVWLQQQS